VTDRPTVLAGSAAIATIVAIAGRGIGLFLATFLMIGAIGEVRGGATDLGLWFVDLTDLPPLVRFALFGAPGGVLLAWSGAAAPGPIRRRSAAIACLAFAGFAARDVDRFADAVATGLVRPAMAVPLSLPIAAVLALGAVLIWRDHGLGRARAGRVRIGVLAVAGLAAVAFPLAQIGFFGTTDYRRPADAAVVLGARVYASGQPSPLLADRIATAVELYRSGLVGTLVMSGGDGADGFNEAAVMRDQAERRSTSRSASGSGGLCSLIAPRP